MFKRKKTDEPAPILPEALEAAADTRTTCYPQDAEPPPPVLGQPRTTVYRQAAKWNRGGYDTVN
jgi:hypothetical protein